MDWIQEIIDKDGVFGLITFIIVFGIIVLGQILGTWVNSVVKLMFILPLELLILILKYITKILEKIVEKMDTFFTKSREFWEIKEDTKDNKDK